MLCPFYRCTHLVNVIRNCRMTLELDATIPGTHFTLPSSLRRHNAHALLFAVAQHSTGLPPFVVRRIRHVQYVTMAERKTARWQPVVGERIVVEESANVQRSFLRRTQQCAGSRIYGRLLLEVVDPGLEFVVVLGSVLGDQVHNATGGLQEDIKKLILLNTLNFDLKPNLQCLCGFFVRRLSQIVSVYAEQLVAAFQFAADIGRTAGQDERHEDALAILAADNIEAETG